jgi:PKD repeat protein
MNKKLLLLFFIAVIFKSSSAQITGSDTVCAGFLYTFNVTVAGADSFVWSYPNGWAEISGSGSSQLQLLCTQNVGQVCVDAYGNGNFIVQYCHDVYWGDGGVGWNLSIDPVNLCQCPPMIATVVPNGTGGGCAGCGSGILSPNIQFAIYDDPWPTGNYIAPADGSSQFPIPFVTTTYYVYQVDLTFGINNAILIDGGLCPATVNNSFTLNGPCMYVNLPIQVIQSPVCIGDTVLLYTDNSLGNYGPYGWNVINGNASLLPAGSSDSVYCIINGPGTIEVNMLGFWGVCPFAGNIYLSPQYCNQSITGDSIVCSGYTYNYSVTIPGAVTYNWTLPTGWYGFTGQGTSSISATCNINEGDICVEAFDINSNSLGTECISTGWGNGSSQGWDVVPNAVSFCGNEMFPTVTPSIVSNGTGSGNCPAGCGSGTQHPNILYALYDETIPYKLFVGIVDGTNAIILPYFIATYTVYLVDTTLGSNFPDAVIISGGCGGAVINNTITSLIVYPVMPTFSQSPDPACIGDTVLITQTENIQQLNWFPDNGHIFLGSPAQNEALIIIDSSSAQISYQGYDPGSGCESWLTYDVNITACLPPTASFAATTNPICPGTCTGFNNLSTGATSSEWLFPGGNPSSSTDVDPSNICYTIPGTYDVTLIASNSNGSDTLYVPGYIIVLPYPPAQGILQSGDTLFSNQGFATYQWYYNGLLIPGATDYFYVGTLDGDYNLISADSNGCEVEAVYFGFIEEIFQNEINSISVSPNPAFDILEIKSSFSIKALSSIRIYDMMGKQVKTPDALKLRNGSAVIDISDLTLGIYLIEVSAGEKIMRKSFIKE